MVNMTGRVLILIGGMVLTAVVVRMQLASPGAGLISFGSQASEAQFAEEPTAKRNARQSLEAQLGAQQTLQQLRKAAHGPPPKLHLREDKGTPPIILEQRERLAIARAPPSNSPPQTFASVFATDCGGPYGAWQAATLEWSWRDVGMEGTLTRVVSGCGGKSAEQIAVAKNSLLDGDPRYATFVVTEDFSHTLGKSHRLFPYRGKPWSVRRWMEAGMPPWSETKPPDVVLLHDPDFAFYRPLTSHPRMKEVRRGHMLAATFDLGGTWIRYFEKMGLPIPPGPSGKPGSIKEDEALARYASGPPWIVERADFIDMIPLWCNYTDEVAEFKEAGDIMAEQEAFLMSALRLNIPLLPDGNTLEISSPISYEEVWTAQWGRRGDKTLEPAIWDTTYVTHFCAGEYRYKNWWFHKSALSRSGFFGSKYENLFPGILECEAYPLQVPPPPPTVDQEADREKRMAAFFMHKLIPRINGASRAYRAKWCPGEAERVARYPRRFYRTVAPHRCKDTTGNKPMVSLYLLEDANENATLWEGGFDYFHEAKKSGDHGTIECQKVPE